MAKNKKVDIYQDVTDRIVKAQEKADQDFINKRQAGRDAVKAQEKADQAEWDRVALIKENAEELLDHIEKIVGLYNSGRWAWDADGVSEAIDFAQVVVEKARGIK